jgi:type I restriction enzyme S subunit
MEHEHKSLITKLGLHIQTQKGFAFKSKWYCNCGISIVKVSNFTNDSVNTDNLTQIPEEIALKYLKTKYIRMTW